MMGEILTVLGLLAGAYVYVGYRRGEFDTNPPTRLGVRRRKPKPRQRTADVLPFRVARRRNEMLKAQGGAR